jgi:hypothetical protein
LFEITELYSETLSAKVVVSWAGDSKEHEVPLILVMFCRWDFSGGRRKKNWRH